MKFLEIYMSVDPVVIALASERGARGSNLARVRFFLPRLATFLLVINISALAGILL